MYRRGFTLVELLVVIAIISILTTIITVGYITYSNRSADNSARSLATQVLNSAERYYNRNLEYPTSTALQGGNTPPTNTKYTSMAQTLDTTVVGLKSGKFKLFPCSGTCTVPNTSGDFVYYLTKGSAAGSSKVYTINGCSFTFPSTEADGQSFIMAYQKKEDGSWQYYRSINGVPTTSNTSTCPFVSN